MQLYSTNDPSHVVSLEEAVFKGLPPDNGLYMPTQIPVLSSDFFQKIHKLTIVEIAVEVCKALFKGYIKDSDLEQIVLRSITFDAPVIQVKDHTYALELFHGPTLAFKDFGARFMANLMGYFLKNQTKEVHILVATSGDTGGAVASGFFQTPGIKVTILYPSGKVSLLQEKQLTTLGQNIKALKVAGTFDDCQKLVKEAFLDRELNEKHNLSSANSINIARLIPQTFYYFNCFARLVHTQLPLVFSVPSGNFGNICAGLLAQKMGLPVRKFIASVNTNDTFVQYLRTGIYQPKPSVQTISNAMDVGNPSNFARIMALFQKDHEKVSAHMEGSSYDDVRTQQTIREVYENTGYLLDPHGAVGYLGLKTYLSSQDEKLNGVFLHTAHPAKFLDIYDPDLKQKVDIPEALRVLEHKPSFSIPLNADYDSFKEYLMSQ